ncbi:MAG: phosphoglycerate dehydrogenase [Gemmatales bacterium]
MLAAVAEPFHDLYLEFSARDPLPGTEERRMPRVMICDKLEAEGITILQSAGIEVDNRPGLKGDELKAALQAADGAIVRSGTRITGDLLETPGKLRAIVRAGVGVDNIDVTTASRKGVIVMNTPGGNTISTCEQTWALIFALMRHTAAADAVMRKGGWDRAKYVGTQLAGKTLGVIGLGRIGREVAKRALAMDMKVIGYDPILSGDRIQSLGFEPASDVPTLLKHSDIVSVHVPMMEQTKDLIGAAQLAMMKKGARIINCARGGIINELALADALKSGHLSGAGVDVFVEEPPPVDHPLRSLPNVVLTPHLGASTNEAQKSVALEAAHLLVDYLVRGQVQSAVNLPAVDRKTLQELRPYLDAARRLGLLLTQLHEGTIKRVSLSFRGEMPGNGMSWLAAAFATGLMETRLSEMLTPVNAVLVAKERGIDIIEEHNPSRGDFATLLSAQIETDKGTHSASATLFGSEYLRLVQLDGFHLESYLDGNLLIFTHKDLPGLIGYIGTVFGRHAVNIAQMVVGRKERGGEAVAVLNLDNLPSEAALAEVKGHEHIKSMHLVKLPPAGDVPAWLA